MTTKHKDVTERLIQINPALAKEARKVLDTNKSERHIRGGIYPEVFLCADSLFLAERGSDDRFADSSIGWG